MYSPLQMAIFLLILNSVVKTYAQVYNSVFAMEELYKTQGDVMKRIQAYVDKSKQKVNDIKLVLNDFEKNHAMFVKDVQHYLGNPIHIFYLLLGLTHNFKFVERTLKDRTVYVRNKQLLYPSRDDVGGSMLSILRLQETYNFKVSDLARGIIISDFNKYRLPIVEQVTPMTSWDCFELSLLPFPNNTKGFRTQIEWLTVALEKYYRWQECLFCTFFEEDIVDHLIKAHHHAGDPDGEIRWLKKRIALTPDDSKNYEREKIIKNLENVKYIKQLESKIGVKLHEPKPEDPEQGGKRWKLYGCYGDYKVNYRGVCMYDTFSPCMTLSPAKMELLRSEPPVALYYDFLTDYEIEILIGLAKIGKMVSSAVHKTHTENTDKNLVLDKGRVAKQVAINESIEEVAKIMHRIRDYTGLRLDNAAPLEVVNYGMAGYIGQHFDPEYKPFPALINERSATIALFLSEPSQGGAVVFPGLALQFFPTRGAALIFDSVYPSGVINSATKHLGCPVITGNKWVALKFTNEDDQTECPLWYDEGNKVFTADRYKVLIDRDREFHKKTYDS